MAVTWRQVVDLLDHDQRLLKRILCRPDGGAAFPKSLAHLFDTRTIERSVVLDDRTDAWEPRWLPHILQLPAFHHFGADARPAPQQEAADGVLAHMLAVLRGVHARCAGEEQMGVPAALGAVRRSVLAGVGLVFSGGLLRDVKNPASNQIWALALALGATCSLTFDAATTHVVSPHAQTSSVGRARQQQLHAVAPAWLADSAAIWKRLPEERYSLLAT